MPRATCATPWAPCAPRQDFAGSLGPLGEPATFVQTAQRLRGGMTARRFTVTFPGRKLTVSTYEMPDGKLEQYLVAPED